MHSVMLSGLLLALQLVHFRLSYARNESFQLRSVLKYDDGFFILNLDDQNIETVDMLPSGDRLLKRVKTIRLNKNQLRCIPIGAFYSFPRANAVWLENNVIEHIASKAFLNNTLSAVGLNHNKLVCLPNLSNQIDHLESFRAEHNLLGLCKSDIKYGGKFNKLARLSFSSNKLTELPDIVLAAPNLRMLKLDDNLLTVVPEIVNFELPPLPRYLSLRNNPIICCIGNTWISRTKPLIKRLYTSCKQSSEHCEGLGKIRNSVEHCMSNMCPAITQVINIPGYQSIPSDPTGCKDAATEREANTTRIDSSATTEASYYSTSLAYITKGLSQASSVKDKNANLTENDDWKISFLEMNHSESLRNSGSHVDVLFYAFTLSVMAKMQLITLYTTGCIGYG